MRRTSVSRLQWHESLQLSAVFRFSQLSDCVLFKLLRLLPTSIFYLGKRAQFRIFQAEYGPEINYALLGSHGLPVHIRSLTSGKLRRFANEKTGFHFGCSTRRKTSFIPRTDARFQSTRLPTIGCCWRPKVSPQFAVELLRPLSHRHHS